MGRGGIFIYPASFFIYNGEESIKRSSHHNGGRNMMNIGLWTGIVLIVAIGAVSEMYRARVKSSSKVTDKLYEEIIERLARVEERMANVETILFEKEKAGQYDKL